MQITIIIIKKTDLEGSFTVKWLLWAFKIMIISRKSMITSSNLITLIIKYNFLFSKKETYMSKKIWRRESKLSSLICNQYS